MSDEKTKLSLGSGVETKTSTRKHIYKSRLDQYLLLAVLSCVVVAGAALAWLAVQVRIGKIEIQTGQKELPRDPYNRALALLTEYPPVDGYVPDCGMT